MTDYWNNLEDVAELSRVKSRISDMLSNPYNLVTGLRETGIDSVNLQEWFGVSGVDIQNYLRQAGWDASALQGTDSNPKTKEITWLGGITTTFHLVYGSNANDVFDLSSLGAEDFGKSYAFLGRGGNDTLIDGPNVADAIFYSGGNGDDKVYLAGQAQIFLSDSGGGDDRIELINQSKELVERYENAKINYLGRDLYTIRQDDFLFVLLDDGTVENTTEIIDLGFSAKGSVQSPADYIRAFDSFTDMSPEAYVAEGGTDVENVTETPNAILEMIGLIDALNQSAVF